VIVIFFHKQMLVISVLC